LSGKLGALTSSKFPLGVMLFTRGVNDRAAEDEAFAAFVIESLNRHGQEDWGDICEEDRKENELSLKEGYRLLSAYEKDGLPKIWNSTEADRSATTVLFPDEY